MTVRISYPPGSHGPHCRRHRCHRAHCADNHGVHADAAASGCSPSSRRCTASGGRAVLSEDQHLQRHWMEGLLFPIQGGNEKLARGGFLICCVGRSWNRAISIPRATLKSTWSPLFNVLTTSLEGEPLRMLYNCNFNGLEAWRRLSKRYSPTSPLRAMQLMLQIISPEKTKDLKHVQFHIDRWESQDLGARERLRREIVREDEGSDPYFDARRGVEGRHLAESRQVWEVRADERASHCHGGGEALGPIPW